MSPDTDGVGATSHVIAEREYRDERGETWTLHLFEPETDDDALGDSRCRFRLLRPDGVEAFATSIAGVDRLQALTGALSVSEAAVAVQPEKLTFLGSTDIGLI